jgi:hypothetical protein
LRINLYNVPIAEPNSLSVLRNKSSSNPRAILMNPSAALHAVKQGRQNVMGMTVMAIGPDVRCSPRYVLSVVKIPRYLSSPARAGLYIVTSATTKSE